MDDFELPQYELILLTEACRTADLCDTLSGQVETAGTLVQRNRFGEDVPIWQIVELRQQRQRLASLLGQLRLPDEDGRKPQNRSGARGPYRPNQKFQGNRMIRSVP